MVLRTNRRTGSLQVAGSSQSTHSSAVQSMRFGPPDGAPYEDGLEVRCLPFPTNDLLTDVGIALQAARRFGSFGE